MVHLLTWIETTIYRDMHIEDFFSREATLHL